MDKILDC